MDALVGVMLDREGVERTRLDRGGHALTQLPHPVLHQLFLFQRLHIECRQIQHGLQGLVRILTR